MVVPFATTTPAEGLWDTTARSARSRRTPGCAADAQPGVGDELDRLRFGLVAQVGHGHRRHARTRPSPRSRCLAQRRTRPAAPGRGSCRAAGRTVCGVCLSVRPRPSASRVASAMVRPTKLGTDDLGRRRRPTARTGAGRRGSAIAASSTMARSPAIQTAGSCPKPAPRPHRSRLVAGPTGTRGRRWRFVPTATRVCIGRVRDGRDWTRDARPDGGGAPSPARERPRRRRPRRPRCVGGSRDVSSASAIEPPTRTGRPGRAPWPCG